VQQAQVSVEQKAAVVLYDPIQVTAAQMIAAVADVGCRASSPAEHARDGDTPPPTTP